MVYPKNICSVYYLDKSQASLPDMYKSLKPGDKIKFSNVRKGTPGECFFSSLEVVGK